MSNVIIMIYLLLVCLFVFLDWGVWGDRSARPETQRSQHPRHSGEQVGVRPPGMPDEDDRGHPKQLDSFLEGFYDIIPKSLISIFNEQELELLISGLPTIDVDDLKANTEYHKYQANSLQVNELCETYLLLQ